MNELISTNDISHKIYTVRGVQVMVDSDLASLYNVETKAFNQAVKRNIERFPAEFRFQLTEVEYNNLRSQIDEKEVYHIGASLKDLGKRWFAFSKLELGSFGLIDKVNEVLGEWCQYQLGEFVQYLNRGITPKYVKSDGITVINQNCIRKGFINFSKSKLSGKHYYYSQEKKLKTDDILINSTGIGTAGRVAIFRYNQ